MALVTYNEDLECIIKTVTIKGSLVKLIGFQDLLIEQTCDQVINQSYKHLFLVNYDTNIALTRILTILSKHRIEDRLQYWPSQGPIL